MLFLKTIEKLKSAGHEIIYKEFSNANIDIAAYYIIANAEASANLSRFDGVRYGRRAEAKIYMSFMQIQEVRALELKFKEDFS